MEKESDAIVMLEKCGLPQVHIQKMSHAARAAFAKPIHCLPQIFHPNWIARFLMSVFEKLQCFLPPSSGVTVPGCAVVDYGVLYMRFFLSFFLSFFGWYIGQ
jgi:hypothetical protein